MSERTTLPALIGWWSVVMLAAGFSALLLEHTTVAVRAIWLHGGMLGLLASVGLESVRRNRQREAMPQRDAGE